MKLQKCVKLLITSSGHQGNMIGNVKPLLMNMKGNNYCCYIIKACLIPHLQESAFLQVSSMALAEVELLLSLVFLFVIFYVHR